MVLYFSLLMYYKIPLHHKDLYHKYHMQKYYIFLKITQVLEWLSCFLIKNNNNHIPGAINVPYEKLILTPDAYLTFSGTYYLYCQKGISSKKIVSLLNRMGYHTVHVEGGYEEWVMKK